MKKIITKKRKVWRTNEQPRLLGFGFPPNTELSSEVARDLLTSDLIFRDNRVQRALEDLNSWLWYRHGDKTVVIVRGTVPSNEPAEQNGTYTAGLGWSVRGQYDRMNEKTGVTLALVRALRDTREVVA